MSVKGEKKVTILKHIKVLREGRNGWTQELNIVSWYGKEAKYDIRWWSKDKTETGKGITLRQDEILILLEALQGLSDQCGVSVQ